MMYALSHHYMPAFILINFYQIMFCAYAREFSNFVFIEYQCGNVIKLLLCIGICYS